MDGSFDTPRYDPAADFPTAVHVATLPDEATAAGEAPTLPDVAVAAEESTALPYEAMATGEATTLPDEATTAGTPLEASTLPDEATAARTPLEASTLPVEEMSGRAAMEVSTLSDEAVAAAAAERTGELPDEAIGHVEAPLNALDDPLNSHFLCLCAKLLYEEQRVVEDIVTHRHESCSHFLLLFAFFFPPPRAKCCKWLWPRPGEEGLMRWDGMPWILCGRREVRRHFWQRIGFHKGA